MHPNLNEPPIFFHLKWVAKIALTVATIVWMGLLLVIFLVTDDNGTDYAHIIANHCLTSHSMGPALLVFGLLMVVIAAITTWVIALYSSFRIAGPLFRFSQNLKSIVEDAFALPVAIRQTDILQREWNEFDTSTAKLRAHYRSLREAFDQCKQTVRTDAGIDTASLAQVCHLAQQT
jgi:hypothetical protein